MGIFVTIEGPNGVGKSTFIQALKEKLCERYSVCLTKEPTETEFGNYVRKNEQCLRGNAYAYLIAADRCYHLEEYVLKKLEQYDIVISDRYIESSLVLQARDGVEINDIWRLNCKFRVPELSVILLASEEKLQVRLKERKVLTYFEKTLTRKSEVDGYREAAEFIRREGFNVLVLQNNMQNELEKNVDTCIKIIQRLMRKQVS